MGTYQKVSFRGGSNTNLNLITCEDKIFIPSIPKSYALHLLPYTSPSYRNGYNREDGFQNLDWIGIRKSLRKEVTNCDTCQQTKQTIIKQGKLPAKEAEKIPRKKLCVDIIGPYFIRRKGQKLNLNLKAVTMIDPVTGWF